MAALVILFTSTGQAQSQATAGGERQAVSQAADDSLRREAEEKYQMRQVGDKVRIWVHNNLRNRIVDGKLTQVRPSGVVVDSVWIARADIEEELQACLFQDTHDEMVTKYIRTQLARKNAEKEAEAKVAVLPSSHMVKTSDGKLYDLSKVMKQEPDGLTFETETGVKKVSFEQLPVEVKTRFGYDKETADAYRDQVAKARAARAVRDAELNRIKLAQKEEEDRLVQARWEEGRKLEQARLEAARIERVAKADAARRAQEAIASDDWPADFPRIKGAVAVRNVHVIGGGGSAFPFGGSASVSGANAPTVQNSSSNIRDDMRNTQNRMRQQQMQNDIWDLKNKVERGW